MKKKLIALVLLCATSAFAEQEIILLHGDYSTPEANTHIAHNESGLYVRSYKVNGADYRDESASLIKANKIDLNKYEMRDFTHLGLSPMKVKKEYLDLCTDSVRSQDCEYFQIARPYVKLGDEITIYQVFTLTSPETFNVDSVLKIIRDGKVIKKINLRDERVGRGFLIH